MIRSLDDLPSHPKIRNHIRLITTTCCLWDHPVNEWMCVRCPSCPWWSSPSPPLRLDPCIHFVFYFFFLSDHETWLSVCLPPTTLTKFVFFSWSFQSPSNVCVCVCVYLHTKSPLHSKQSIRCFFVHEFFLSGINRISTHSYHGTQSVFLSVCLSVYNFDPFTHTHTVSLDQFGQISDTHSHTYLVTRFLLPELEWKRTRITFEFNRSSFWQQDFSSRVDPLLDAAFQVCLSFLSTCFDNPVSVCHQCSFVTSCRSPQPPSFCPDRSLQRSASSHLFSFFFASGLQPSHHHHSPFTPALTYLCLLLRLPSFIIPICFLIFNLLLVLLTDDDTHNQLDVIPIPFALLRTDTEIIFNLQVDMSILTDNFQIPPFYLTRLCLNFISINYFLWLKLISRQFCWLNQVHSLCLIFRRRPATIK